MSGSVIRRCQCGSVGSCGAPGALHGPPSQFVVDSIERLNSSSGRLNSAMSSDVSVTLNMRGIVAWDHAAGRA
jgi:hypothetical protein